MRYLIHTGPGIGDIIQFLSMARAIKEAQPDATVDFLMCGSDKYYSIDSQIMECQNYASNLYWYSAKELIHSIKLIFILKRNQYDYGIVRISSVNGKKSLWIYYIMHLAGCKQIIGTGTKKVDTFVDIPERTHYLKRNALLLAPIGITGRTDALALDKAKLDMDWIYLLKIPNKRKKIAFSVGTNPMVWKGRKNIITYDVKSWSYENWFRLAIELDKRGYIVILVGGTKEQDEIKMANLSIPKGSNIYNFIGKLSLKRSLSIISICDLVVGAEGGMMHCASSLGIQTLTIFGGSDYKMWNPGGINSEIVNLFLKCSPCFCTEKAAHCKEHCCLTDISPLMVLDKIELLFNSNIVKLV